MSKGKRRRFGVGAAYKRKVLTTRSTCSGDSLVLALGAQGGKVKRLSWSAEDGAHEVLRMDRLGS